MYVVTHILKTYRLYTPVYMYVWYAEYVTFRILSGDMYVYITYYTRKGTMYAGIINLFACHPLYFLLCLVFILFQCVTTLWKGERTWYCITHETTDYLMSFLRCCYMYINYKKSKHTVYIVLAYYARNVHIIISFR